MKLSRPRNKSSWSGKAAYWKKMSWIFFDIAISWRRKRKKYQTFRLLSITLGVFHYLTVVVYAYIYIPDPHIYIFTIVDDFSPPSLLYFSLSDFFCLVDIVQNDYFYANVYFVWWERRKKMGGGLISFFRHNSSWSFSSTVHYRWKRTEYDCS